MPYLSAVCASISIHALREEGDQGNTAALSVTTIFLSTPSARRATKLGGLEKAAQSHFYPRPPRGGRHHRYFDLSRGFLFLSTPSARRATRPIRR